MLKRLMEEIARPNGTAALFLVGILACESAVLLGWPEIQNQTLALAALAFCVGGYAGSLWANWGGGDR